jgi:hypothetical protein
MPINDVAKKMSQVNKSNFVAQQILFLTKYRHLKRVAQLKIIYTGNLNITDRQEFFYCIDDKMKSR